MLEVEGLAVAYGGKRALHEIDLAVAENEVVALVGHNGAGKTTLLRSIMGLVSPAAGTIRFRGRLARPGDTAALVRSGLSFVPQGRNVFRDLTVGENLRIARSIAGGGDRVDEAEMFRLFPVLRERAHQLAGALSGGQQQMLALACALVRAPRLVLLDEPSTGLAPVLVEEVFRTTAGLRRDLGTSFVIVDQNVASLLDIADLIYVLKAGEVVYAGDPAQLRDAERLWKLF